MRREYLETIKKRLLARREELLLEIRRRNAEAADLTDEGVPDMEDRGLMDNLQEFLHLLSDSKREELTKIDEALERLAEGSYGRCLRCASAIDPARLQLAPHTRYCITCKEALEAEENRKEGPGRGTL